MTLAFLWILTMTSTSPNESLASCNIPTMRAFTIPTFPLALVADSKYFFLYSDPKDCARISPFVPEMTTHKILESDLRIASQSELIFLLLVNTDLRVPIQEMQRLIVDLKMVVKISVGVRQSKLDSTFSLLLKLLSKLSFRQIEDQTMT